MTGAAARSPIGPIVESTVVVADLAEALERYLSGFGWVVRTEKSRFAAARAERWGVPALSETRTVVIGPPEPAAVAGAVRLVEVPKVIAPAPLRSFGWTALELCVRDVLAATDRAAAAGWTVLRPPARLGAGKLPLSAAQLAAPSGEAVYLTQILAPVPGFELPSAAREVDGVFIAVLGASDLETTRMILERRFAVRRASDRRGPIGVLNDVYGLPPETTHRLSTLQLAGRSCVEIDQLPSMATRRGSSGAIHGGVVTVTVGSAGGSGEVLTLPDGAILELLPGAAVTGS